MFFTLTLPFIVFNPFITHRVAWFIYSKIISKVWFDVFILINILAIGAVTGLDLESDGNSNITCHIEYSVPS